MLFQHHEVKHKRTSRVHLHQRDKEDTKHTNCEAEGNCNSKNDTKKRKKRKRRHHKAQDWSLPIFKTLLAYMDGSSDLSKWVAHDLFHHTPTKCACGKHLKKVAFQLMFPPNNATHCIGSACMKMYFPHLIPVPYSRKGTGAGDAYHQREYSDKSKPEYDIRTCVECCCLFYIYKGQETKRCKLCQKGYRKKRRMDKLADLKQQQEEWEEADDRRKEREIQREAQRKYKDLFQRHERFCVVCNCHVFDPTQTLCRRCIFACLC